MHHKGASFFVFNKKEVNKIYNHFYEKRILFSKIKSFFFTTI